jgi:hypothetical protein
LNVSRSSSKRLDDISVDFAFAFEEEVLDEPLGKTALDSGEAGG